MKVINALAWLFKKDEVPNDTITIDHATFSKERIKKIEDGWVRDGLIR